MISFRPANDKTNSEDTTTVCENQKNVSCGSEGGSDNVVVATDGAGNSAHIDAQTPSSSPPPSSPTAKPQQIKDLMPPKDLPVETISLPSDNLENNSAMCNGLEESQNEDLSLVSPSTDTEPLSPDDNGSEVTSPMSPTAQENGCWEGVAVGGSGSERMDQDGSDQRSEASSQGTYARLLGHPLNQ